MVKSPYSNTIKTWKDNEPGKVLNDSQSPLLGNKEAICSYDDHIQLHPTPLFPSPSTNSSAHNENSPVAIPVKYRSKSNIEQFGVLINTLFFFYK